MTLLLNAQDLKNAQDGYEVFFEAFIRNNPRKYISFDDFVYKHYASENQPKTQMVIAHRHGKPVAVQFYISVTVLFRGREYPCVQAADTASTSEGRGATFLKMYVSGEKQQAQDGIAFRYGTPNENSMRFTEKLGSIILGVLSGATASRAEVESADGFRANRQSGLIAQAVVETSQTCPFSSRDFNRLNSDVNHVMIMRTPAYYAHRVDGLPNRRFAYYTVRMEQELIGHLVIEDKGNKCGSICDWSVHGTPLASDSAIVSLLIESAFNHFDKLTIPVLNPDSAEASLFEQVGFKIRRDSKGNPAGSNFAYTPFREDLDDGFLESANWKIRMIDLDWHLNCYQSI